jgi:hypothetical protein
MKNSATRAKDLNFNMSTLGIVLFEEHPGIPEQGFTPAPDVTEGVAHVFGLVADLKSHAAPTAGGFQHYLEGLSASPPKTNRLTHRKSKTMRCLQGLGLGA